MFKRTRLCRVYKSNVVWYTKSSAFEQAFRISLGCYFSQFSKVMVLFHLSRKRREISQCFSSVFRFFFSPKWTNVDFFHYFRCSASLIDSSSKNGAKLRSESSHSAFSGCEDGKSGEDYGVFVDQGFIVK